MTEKASKYGDVNSYSYNKEVIDRLERQGKISPTKATLFKLLAATGVVLDKTKLKYLLDIGFIKDTQNALFSTIAVKVKGNQNNFLGVEYANKVLGNQIQFIGYQKVHTVLGDQVQGIGRYQKARTVKGNQEQFIGYQKAHTVKGNQEQYGGGYQKARIVLGKNQFQGILGLYQEAHTVKGKTTNILEVIRAILFK